MQKKVAAKSVSKSKKLAQKSPKDKIIGYKTVAMNYASWRDPSYIYKVGDTFTVSNATKDGKACGVGLHFAPTKQGALSYADGESSYRMLLVEAEEKDLLGKDSEKFRVSKLTIVKELEQVDYPTKEWKAAAKDVEQTVKKLYLTPSKSLTTQKISGLAHSYLKSVKSKAKLHIVTNVFEAAYIAIRSEDYHFDSDTDTESDDFVCRLNIPSNNVTNNVYTNTSIESQFKSFLNLYLTSKNDDSLPSQDALYELVKLGCSPLRLTPKHFYLFVPQSPVLKMKLSF